MIIMITRLGSSLSGTYVLLYCLSNISGPALISFQFQISRYILGIYALHGELIQSCDVANIVCVRSLLKFCYELSLNLTFSSFTRVLLSLYCVSSFYFYLIYIENMWSENTNIIFQEVKYKNHILYISSNPKSSSH